MSPDQGRNTRECVTFVAGHRAPPFLSHANRDAVVLAIHYCRLDIIGGQSKIASNLVPEVLLHWRRIIRYERVEVVDDVLRHRVVLSDLTTLVRIGAAVVLEAWLKRELHFLGRPIRCPIGRLAVLGIPIIVRILRGTPDDLETPPSERRAGLPPGR
ncbi:hypothetical protein ACVIIV_003455 [Bradyrhizobium sp. USDA 4354]